MFHFNFIASAGDNNGKNHDGDSVMPQLSVTDPRISGLEKQLRIETMVKHGAENMLKSYAANNNKVSIFHKVSIVYIRFWVSTN